MLKVNPKVRPSAAMILSFIERIKEDPNLIKNLSESDRRLFLINNLNNPEFEEDGLLGTIKVPLDMNSIDQTLPKPNFSEEFKIEFLKNPEGIAPHSRHQQSFA